MTVSVFLPDGELLQDRDLPSFSLHLQCPARSPLQSAQVELTSFGKSGAYVILGEKKQGEQGLCSSNLFQSRNLQSVLEVSFNFIHLEKVDILYLSLD